MKKLITSAGLAVLGAASLNAQQIYAPAPGLTATQLAKPWSVSAAVRGFYDDNYALTPSGGLLTAQGARISPRDSFGFEVTPSASLNWAMEQTYFGLGYVYSLKWFEDRRDNEFDQSHQANVKLSHAFTDRHKLDLADSFVYTREPNLIAPINVPAATIRSRQDMLRNHASATFGAGLTDQLSTVLGYSNTLYDFRDSGPRSYSSLLDRMEHLGTVNLRWQALPSTVGILGYQFGVTHYTDDKLTGIPFRGTELFSDERNTLSHYAYVGIDHSFNPQLETALRVGAQFTEYYNLPGPDEDRVTPYADGNITYRMTPDSAVQLGVRHSRLPTDAEALDQENTTVYGSFNYRIIPPLTASLLGQYQYNTFEFGQPTRSGLADFRDQSEHFWLAGVNLTYEFTRFLAAEAGYNYDRLDSDVHYRSFTRNRVYVGLRATY